MAEETELGRLDAVLEKKVKTGRCPFCETEHWYLLDKEGLSSGLVLSNGTYPKVYTLSCTNCGFVRQHLRQVVDQ